MERKVKKKRKLKMTLFAIFIQSDGMDV